MTQSGHKFAHATTAQLSWHVQNCDLISWLFFAQEQYVFWRDLNYELKNPLWNVSLTGLESPINVFRDEFCQWKANMYLWLLSSQGTFSDAGWWHVNLFHEKCDLFAYPYDIVNSIPCDGLATPGTRATAVLKLCILTSQYFRFIYSWKFFRFMRYISRCNERLLYNKLSEFT